MTNLPNKIWKLKGSKNDKHEKRFVLRCQEERYPLVVCDCSLVCLGDLINLFLKVLACSTHRTKVGLWKGPATMVGNAKEQINSVFYTFLQGSYSQQ